MDKEINPYLALLILSLFISLIGVRFWAGGEMAKALPGSVFLEPVPGGGISIQAGRKLYRINHLNDSPEVFDLRAFAEREPWGNVVHVTENEILLRLAPGDTGLGTWLGSASLRDPVKDQAKEALFDSSGGYAPLMKCVLPGGDCTPYRNVQLPWRYRLALDTNTQTLYVTEATLHKVRWFNVAGELQGEIKKQLKFPKRVRVAEDGRYVVNTNGHGIQYFSGEEGDQALPSPVHLVPKTHKGAEWTVDAVQFGGNWWVINAYNGMFKSVLHRFDAQGKFVKEYSFEDASNLSDLLVWKNELFVADSRSGLIHRFDAAGKPLDGLTVLPLVRKALELKERRSYYETIIQLISGLLILFVVGGGTWAVLVARQHRKENPVFVLRHDAVPEYLAPNFQLMSPVLSAVDVPSNRPKEVIVGDILISNIEIVPGKRIVQHFGLVQGSTVRAKHAGKDIMAGFKNIFGGELKSYTELLSESRQEAIDRMSDQAKAIGANAVLNVRFSTSSIAAGASEILAYGTAVLVEDA